VVKWQENGEDYIFVSSKAVLDGSRAIRGGVPVIFPQFSNFGSLPAHGFARNMLWSIISTSTGGKSEDKDEHAEVVFGLSPSDSSRKVWNHDFYIEYTVRLSGVAQSRLSLSLLVRNSGNEEFSFTSALHSYFRVGDVSKARVTASGKDGLNGLTYLDNLQQGKSESQKNQDVRFEGEVDRVYVQVPRQLLLVDEARSRQISIRSEGFPDAVVWNPWIDKSKSFTDMAPTEYLSMVCVESAVIRKPVALSAGDEFKASVVLSASVTSESSC